jgi:SAM-dependent methyltransferase
MHNLASSGFTNPSLYNSSRPSYPVAVVDDVIDLLPATMVGRDDGVPRVLELGAGTGKFTEIMLDRLNAKYDRFEYTVNEPSALAKSLEPLVERYGVRHGVTINTRPVGLEPVSDDKHKYDIIVAAQSFHWFTPYPASYMACRNLLIKGGALCLVWNERDVGVDWIRRFEEDVITPLYPKSNNEGPRQQNGQWEEAFEHFLGNYYGNLHRRQYEDRDGILQTTGYDGVVRRVLSLSVVNALKEVDKNRVECSVREWLENDKDTKGKDNCLVLDHFTDTYYTRTIG